MTIINYFLFILRFLEKKQVRLKRVNKFRFKGINSIGRRENN